VSGIAFASALGNPVCDGDKLAPPEPAGMGIIAHEYLHTFGLIDVYDQDEDEPIETMGGLSRFDMCVLSNKL
jgi:hypothetical protein